MKRVFDTLAAAVLLAALGPIIVALWGLVVLTSGLPGFFRQTRVGRHGQDFTLLKLRTMERSRGAEHGTFAPGCARRVTRVGRHLRRWKLDELPQLWNVLRGDMAMVGPRPEVRTWVDAYPERWRTVLTVRPGITDPASIQFRHEEEILAAVQDPEAHYRHVILPQKLDWYEHYVETRSLRGDTMILLATAKAVLWAPSRPPTTPPDPSGIESRPTSK